MSNIPSDSNRTYLVTGAIGFIGYYFSQMLLDQGARVIGIDNLNDYYDVNLKHTRLDNLKPYNNFMFIQDDIANKENLMQTFETYKPNVVVNLAAQAGVRYSLENPDVYIQSNTIGFYNILEACRFHPVDHLIYASSSSVYGAYKKVPFEEADFVDNPVSLYASTKKSNELMAHTYSHLYNISASGLRFFTVYGPMGRPDMAYFGFTDKYFAGEPIKIFNNGDFENDLYRGFTYIDDIVEGMERLINVPPKSEGPHRIYNISPEKLMIFIHALEKALSSTLDQEVEFEKVYEPMKPEDVPATYASADRLRRAVGFKPETSIVEGLKTFAEWYVWYLRHLAVLSMF